MRVRDGSHPGPPTRTPVDRSGPVESPGRPGLEHPGPVWMGLLRVPLCDGTKTRGNAPDHG